MSKYLSLAAFMLGLAGHAVDAQNVPPNSFRGQVWTSGTGCKYTRAGRQGEAVWYLILNSRKGRKCELQIVQTRRN